MAGILFTSRTHTLAGYDSRKKSITGIGGKKKGGEFPYETAVREVVEELFELEVVSNELIKTIIAFLTFDKCISNGSYTTYIMTFYDLEKIMSVVYTSGVRSLVYDQLPKTINDLILTRQLMNQAELKHLVLIPREADVRISNSLISDIQTFNSME